jgi:hypothetical protein
MGRGREARPMEERGTLCEGRGRASGATGYRRVNGRVVAGFPFFGPIVYRARWERSARRSADETKGCGRPR